MPSTLLSLFSHIPDPRRDQRKMYPLAPILLFTVLAMLAGARSYRQVHCFIRTHLDRLKSGFGLSLRRSYHRRIDRGSTKDAVHWPPGQDRYGQR